MSSTDTQPFITCRSDDNPVPDWDCAWIFLFGEASDHEIAGDSDSAELSRISPVGGHARCYYARGRADLVLGSSLSRAPFWDIAVVCKDEARGHSSLIAQALAAVPLAQTMARIAPGDTGPSGGDDWLAKTIRRRISALTDGSALVFDLIAKGEVLGIPAFPLLCRTPTDSSARLPAGDPAGACPSEDDRACARLQAASPDESAYAIVCNVRMGDGRSRESMLLLNGSRYLNRVTPSYFEARNRARSSRIWSLRLAVNELSDNAAAAANAGDFSTLGCNLWMRSAASANDFLYPLKSGESDRWSPIGLVIGTNLRSSRIDLNSRSSGNCARRIAATDCRPPAPLPQRTNLPLNLLFKGVPGTGKSFLADQIIRNFLSPCMPDLRLDPIVRINVHAGSDNADLMRGIGAFARGNAILYEEKRGPVYRMIERACLNPEHAFALIIEEIQENSLNELVGDLIFLLDEDKRIPRPLIRAALDRLSGRHIPASMSLVADEMLAAHGHAHVPHVLAPNLVDPRSGGVRMILPDNLYVFCTTNYRPGRRIIEDNLLRRFTVIDVTPRPETIANPDVRLFFSRLNEALRKSLAEEVHSERIQIGHASWMRIGEKGEDPDGFARALHKALTEMKEFHSLDFEEAVLTPLRAALSPSCPRWIAEIAEEALSADDFAEALSRLQHRAYAPLLTSLNPAASVCSGA